METILVVEDDSTIFQPLLDFLARNSFQVGHAGTLNEADAALAGQPDAIVLDWALPDGDGVQWLKTLRARGYLRPVIMLTARADLLDKVVGLEGGANDYLTKPFEPRELVARLHAQLRSFHAPRPYGYKETEDPIASSGIVLDPDALEVTWLGKPATLTQMEFKLLRYFLEHPRRALSRENILNAVWGLRYPSTRTVDVHVMQLRQKFKPELFQTLHGTGYRFVPDDELLRK